MTEGNGPEGRPILMESSVENKRSGATAGHSPGPPILNQVICLCRLCREIDKGIAVESAEVKGDILYYSMILIRKGYGMIMENGEIWGFL